MITLDSTSSTTAIATSLTISHTIAGSNRILIVGVAGGATDVITGVTYDGVAMTRIGIQNNGNSTSYLYYLLAPNTGTHDIVISSSISTSLAGEGVSFNGVAQSGQPTVTVTNTASAANACANTLTTTENDSIHIATFAIDANPVTSITNGTSVGSIMGYSNPLKISPAASHTMTGNSSGGNNAWATVGASFSQAAGVSSSASLSPSSSASASLSPSSSISSSPSASASSSTSSSISPSSSSSASLSPSSSLSASISPSSSLSPSSSQSASLSPSSSISPSASISASISPSPSQGYSLFTRSAVSVLPTDDADLATTYSDDDEGKVEELDDIRVGQTGVLEYMIHQFKSFIGSQTIVTIYWEGQSTLAPRQSIISLQIFNRSTNVWETIASNNSSPEDSDLELTDTITDLTHYKDSSNVISCRVYQLAI